MDFAGFQTALKAWITTVTGLPCIMTQEPRPALIRVNAFVTLDNLSEISAAGQDYYTEETDPEDPYGIIPTIIGRRLFTVTIKVLSRSQSPEKTGEFYLEKLRTSLKKPSVLEHFQANDMAIVRLGPTASYPNLYDDRQESIAAAEFRLACAVVDTDSAIGTIGTIEVSSHLKDPGNTELPVPPNLDEEIFQVEE